ncbi:hypothetical protein JY651_45800 [Pyxidicoccus parkwayensis]|uniref:Uncharacterized protein n=1 Tax=Pyxidicoccus parkwayensis TaxID=2813578 RepID=A0ABX7NU12_9BACT|nr:hypothetical protein [Pyxidicoccus parkwaysis]QSQ22362.1 hypothetical protein JY651_45800 [Pyxidicoccus parkwaysis]
MSRIGCGEDYGGAASSDAMHFWTSWAAASSASYMNMLLRGSTWFQSMLMGGAPSTQHGSRGTPPLSGFFEDWFRLASFPFQWWSRSRGDDIPVLVIALDVSASTKGDYQVMTPYCVPDSTVQVTPLRKLEDPGKEFSPNTVEVKLRQDGNAVTVSLIDLQLGDKDRGFYIALVWTADGAERRPLAILNVIVM